MSIEVKISLNGNSFTTTSQRFNFFTVTDASACVMFGTGLMNLHGSHVHSPANSDNSSIASSFRAGNRMSAIGVGSLGISPDTSSPSNIIMNPNGTYAVTGCLCNEDISFFIQARDKWKKNRTTGGDEFKVYVSLVASNTGLKDLCSCSRYIIFVYFSRYFIRM